MVQSIVFTLEELRGYSAKAGLGLQFVIKDAFLFELAEILGEYGFILKGGTAINKGYLKGHQRFSEDLDYDTVEEKAKVRQIIHKLGWVVKREYFMRNSIGFMLGYEFEGIQDSVKVDFAFKVEGRYERKEMSSDFIPISKRVTMYGIRDLVAQKEGAFEDRIEWKDLYDLYWIAMLYPKDFKINDKKRFANALEKISVPKTANGFIPVKTRPNWTEVKEAMQGIIDKENQP